MSATPTGAETAVAAESVAMASIALAAATPADAERVLMQAAQHGDSEAFTQVVERLAPRLWRLLAARGIAPSACDDLVQDTFVRAHAALARYDVRWAPMTWLSTIALRLASNRRRDRRREQPLLAGVHEPTAPDVRVRDPDADGLWDLARQVLPERSVTALWLHYAEDLPVAEIATALGLTALHTRVIMHRARARLQTHLERRRTP